MKAAYFICTIVLLVFIPLAKGETMKPKPQACEAMSDAELKSTQLATFGGGCFWGVEEAFRTLPGVVKTTVGYEGGKKQNPTYEDVCTDKTGYAEVVQIEFDPTKISYEKLLETFWKIHNPTTLNRQGPDVGTQYRSVIFYHTPEQKAAALASEKEEQKKTKGKIVTQIVPAAPFYRAEEYHQQYLLKNGKASCHIQ